MNSLPESHKLFWMHYDSHLLDSPVPNSDSVARIKQVLHNPTAHDAQSKETKVQFAWLDVFLPEDLATGNQVHVQGRTSRPGQRGSVQQVGHSGARLLHGGSVHWTLSSLPFTANCPIKLYNGANGHSIRYKPVGAGGLFGFCFQLRPPHFCFLGWRGGAGRSRCGAVAISASLQSISLSRPFLFLHSLGCVLRRYLLPIAMF